MGDTCGLPQWDNMYGRWFSFFWFGEVFRRAVIFEIRVGVKEREIVFEAVELELEIVGVIRNS